MKISNLIYIVIANYNQFGSIVCKSVNIFIF